MGKLFKFVFTGGPCSGKSTSIGRIRNFLETRGYIVVSIPEAATIAFSNGINFHPENKAPFQLAISSIQCSNEKHFVDYARRIADQQPRDVVVLLDRAIIDGAAYVTEKEFDEILRKIGMPAKPEIFSSYDLVFFLVTAAKGAETFYGLKGVRHESVEAARETDDLTLQAWRGHPNLHFFDNENKTFETKMKDVISTMCSELGIPHTKKIPRRFLLSEEHFQIPSDLLVTKRFVEKIFIRKAKPGGQSQTRRAFTFIRSSSCRSASSFVQKTVKYENGQRIEEKESITKRQYSALREFSDPNHVVVHQKRSYFAIESTHYEICEYVEPSCGLKLLSVYCSDASDDEEARMPSFLRVGEEVTHCTHYSSHFLSRVDQERSYEFGETICDNRRAVYYLLNGKQNKDLDGGNNGYRI